MQQQGSATRITTGRSIADALAADYTLRPVLAAMGAREVLGGVHALEAKVLWSHETGLKLESDLAERMQRAISHLSQSAGPYSTAALSSTISSARTHDFTATLERTAV